MNSGGVSGVPLLAQAIKTQSVLSKFVLTCAFAQCVLTSSPAGGSALIRSWHLATHTSSALRNGMGIFEQSKQTGKPQGYFEANWRKNSVLIGRPFGHVLGIE